MAEWQLALTLGRPACNQAVNLDLLLQAPGVTAVLVQEVTAGPLCSRVMLWKRCCSWHYQWTSVISASIWLCGNNWQWSWSPPSEAGAEGNNHPAGEWLWALSSVPFPAAPGRPIWGCAAAPSGSPFLQVLSTARWRVNGNRLPFVHSWKADPFLGKRTFWISHQVSVCVQTLTHTHGTRSRCTPEGCRAVLLCTTSCSCKSQGFFFFSH